MLRTNSDANTPPGVPGLNVLALRVLGLALFVVLASVPLEAQDCQPNGVTDDVDIADGTSQDCDGNLVPDECDLVDGAPDCNQNGVLDVCETPPLIQAAFDTTTRTPCVGSDVAFQDLSTGGPIDSYLWGFGDGTTSTESSPSHAYAQTGFFEVTLTVSGPCGQDTETQSNFVEVLDVTADFSSSTTAACAGQTIDFTSLSSGGVTSWSWTFGDGASSPTENPSHTYATPGTYSVSLRVDGNCGSDEIASEVTVLEPPVAEFSVSSTEVCAGVPVTFTESSTGVGLDSFAWTFGDGGTSNEPNPQHTYDAPGSYPVMLIVGGTCGADTETKPAYITVRARPVASFEATPPSVCLGTAIAFNNISGGVGGETFLWEFGDNETSTEESPTYTYAAAGTYRVRLTITDRCGEQDAAEADVNVLESATATFDVSRNPVCAGDTITFTNRSSGGSTSTFAWDFGDGGTSSDENATHSYATPGVYTVALRVDSDCGSEERSRDITVLEPPVAEFSTSSTEICAGEQVTFTESSTGGGIEIFAWSFGDDGASNERNPQHTYDGPGTYTVTLTVGGTCGADTETKTDYVTVRARPVASFDATPSSACLGTAIAFNNLSGGVGGGTFLWEFGDNETSTDEDPSHTYAATGTYRVRLTITDLCGEHTAQADVNVVESATAAFDVSSNAVCVDAAITFTNRSSGGSASTFAWDFGDGNTSNEEGPTHRFSVLGERTIRLTVSGSCGSDTQEKTVMVHDLPNPGFSVSDTEPCVDSPVAFTNTSSGFGDLTFEWDFGDSKTSTEVNPTHTYTSPGAYTVSLRATGDCGTLGVSGGEVVTVQPGVTADFSASRTTICVGETIDFTSLSSGSPTSFEWDFGDQGTSTDQNPQHPYDEPGTYPVMLTVRGTCGADTETKTDYITVQVRPVAGFEATPSSVCLGAAIAFTNLSGGVGVDTFLWEFGDGMTSTDENPTHNYEAASPYSVRLTVTDQCGEQDTVEGVVNVIESTVAAFDVSSNAVCNDAEVTFTNRSSGGSGPSTFAWDFGDGESSSEENPTHSYAAPGDYMVRLRVDNDCGSDEVSPVDPINVGAAAIPDFEVVGPTEVCVDERVEFRDLSTNANEILSYEWDFGDGGRSSNRFPQHGYSVPGQYAVTLTVASRCGTRSETKQNLITVREPPIADFNASPVTVCLGEPVVFTDESVGADITVTVWRFGDGEESNETSPSHAYSQPGFFSVVLEIESACGADTVEKPMFVEVLEDARVEFEVTGAGDGSASVCADDPVKFVNLSAGAGSGNSQWRFGDGTTSTEDSPTHRYQQPGTYDVTLSVDGDCGSTRSTRPGLVVVLAPVAVDFVAAATTICVGESVELTHGTDGPSVSDFRWDFGDGSTASDELGNHVYTEPGTYTVALQVNGPCGAVTVTQEDLITVLEPPRADFGIVAAEEGSVSACLGVAIDFADRSSGTISEYAWDFGDGSNSAEASPSHAYAVAGLYTVSLTVTGDCGSDTTEVADLVFAQDDVGVVSGLSYPASGFVNDIVPIRWTPLANATAYRVEARVGSGGEFFELPQSPVENDPSIEQYALRTLVDRVGTWFFRITALNDCSDGEPALGPPLGIVPEEIIGYWPVSLSDCSNAVVVDVEGGHDGEIGGGVVGCGRDRLRRPTETLEFRSQGLVTGGQLPVVGGDFTLSLWVQPLAEGSGSRPFIEITPDPSRADDPSTEPLRALWNPTNSSITVEHNAPPGAAVRIEDVGAAWHHLVISRLDGTLSVFLDGSLEESLPHTVKLGEEFALGGSRDGITRFAGSIDDVLYESRARGENEVLALILDEPTTIFLGGVSSDEAVSVPSAASQEALRLQLRSGAPLSADGFSLENLSIELQDVTPGSAPRPFDFVEELVLLARSSCDGTNPQVEEIGRFTQRETGPGRALFDLASAGDAGLSLSAEQDLCFGVELVVSDTPIDQGRVFRALLKTPDDLVIADGTEPAFIAGSRRVTGQSVTGPELHLRDRAPTLKLTLEARSGDVQTAARGSSIDAHVAILESDALEEVRLTGFNYASVENRRLPELTEIELLLDDEVVGIGQLAGDRRRIEFVGATVVLPTGSQGRLVLRAVVVDTVTASAVRFPVAGPHPRWLALALLILLAAWPLTGLFRTVRHSELGARRLRRTAVGGAAGAVLAVLVGCGPALIGGALGLGLGGGGGGGGGSGGGLGPGQFQVRLDDEFQATGARTQEPLELTLAGEPELKGPIFEMDG